MMFGKIDRQRGAGSIGCLFLIVIVAAGMYAAFQFTLPRLRHSSFEERISESYVHLSQQSAADVQKQIIQIATDFDIELKPPQVKVDNTGHRLRIDVTYEKLIDLKFWQKTVPFRVHRDPAP